MTTSILIFMGAPRSKESGWVIQRRFGGAGSWGWTPYEDVTDLLPKEMLKVLEASRASHPGDKFQLVRVTEEVFA